MRYDAAWCALFDCGSLTPPPFTQLRTLRSAACVLGTAAKPSVLGGCCLVPVPLGPMHARPPICGRFPAPRPCAPAAAPQAAALKVVEGAHAAWAKLTAPPGDPGLMYGLDALAVAKPKLWLR